MTRPSDQQLEILFDEHGISRRRLYPWWYRLRRVLGMDPKPPVLFTLADHFLYDGLSGVAVLAVGCLIAWPFTTIPLPALLPPIVVIAVLIPLYNWWYYRGIRRRIGL